MSDRTGEAALTIEDTEAGLLRYLGERLRAPITVDHDIFASGLVSSMFAMELVVHLESTYGISIGGADLRLDNFRTVRQMSSLVLRLRGVTVSDV